MGSWKLETDVDPDGLPRFLRDLADVLESGAVEAGAGAGELAGLPVAELRKLVLVASAQGEGFALTLKAKRGHEVRVGIHKTVGDVFLDRVQILFDETVIQHDGPNDSSGTWSAARAFFQLCP